MTAVELKPVAPVRDDIDVLPSEGHGQLHDASTEEVLTMVLGDDDEIGRMDTGLDLSEFDAAPPRQMDLVEDENGYSDSLDVKAALRNGLFTNAEEEVEDYELDERAAERDAKIAGLTPELFEAPKEQFPAFKSALRRFQAAAPKNRVVRVDTEETFGEFVCENAVKEISRRVSELRAALENHLEEHKREMHPGYRGKKSKKAMSKWEDIVGAAQAVSDLRTAKDANEAAAAMPQVPLDIPPWAEGKVRCWRNGDTVVCSLRFAAADNSTRIATMAARPRVDTDEVARSAMRAGIDPVTVLGVLDDLAAVACGKRLLKDVAGAALRVSDRLDVLGMAKDGTDDPSVGVEPLLLSSNSGVRPDAVPVAALAHLAKCAGKGDRQARSELAQIRAVASTPVGREVVAPLLAKASKLVAAPETKALPAKKNWAQRYADTAMWL